MLYSGESVPELDPVTDMIFGVIQERIDRDTALYLEKVEKRREAGKLGGRPKANASDENQTKAKKAHGFSEKQNNPDNDNVPVIKKESIEKSSRFSPPTRQDVAEYCAEKGFSDLDVERFVDYYTSNGWMVGKSKMKDRKAAVRNWARAGKAPKESASRFVISSAKISIRFSLLSNSSIRFKVPSMLWSVSSITGLLTSGAAFTLLTPFCLLSVLLDRCCGII